MASEAGGQVGAVGQTYIATHRESSTLAASCSSGANEWAVRRERCMQRLVRVPDCQECRWSERQVVSEAARSIATFDVVKLMICDELSRSKEDVEDREGETRKRREDASGGLSFPSASAHQGVSFR